MINNTQVETVIREAYIKHGITPPKKLLDRELVLGKYLLENAVDIDSRIVLDANSDLKSQNLELMQKIKELRNEKRGIALSSGIELIGRCVLERPITFILIFLALHGLSYLGIRTVTETMIPNAPCATINRSIR